MAGIRKLYEEVADLLAVMIQLHQEMQACHQAQKDREAQLQEQMQTGIESLGELVSRGLLARGYIEDLEAALKKLRNHTLFEVFMIALIAGIAGGAVALMIFRAALGEG